MGEPAPVFLGAVRSGALVFQGLPVVSRYLRGLEGEDVEVIIRKLRSQRSLAQNAYWWAVPVEIMAEFMGEDRPATHYALLGECFGYHLNEKVGKQVPNKGSSSALTVEEFSALIEWCPPWAMTTFGVSIPLPNECDFQVAMEG